MFVLRHGDYEFAVGDGMPGTPGWPVSAATGAAALIDRFGPLGHGSEYSARCTIAVRHADRGILLFATLDYGQFTGLTPAGLFVPETDVLFVGAGVHILAYDLRQPRRLWEDQAACGFWAWHRFGDVIVLQAEVELAAWDLRGTKLWSQFADPPHEVRFVPDRVVLADYRGTQTLDLRTGQQVGPTAPRA